MPPLGYMPGASSPIESIKYAVATTGNAMFQPTVASSDSPDYTTCKVEANQQVVKLSPLAEESVA